MEEREEGRQEGRDESEVRENGVRARKRVETEMRGGTESERGIAGGGIDRGKREREEEETERGQNQPRGTVSEAQTSVSVSDSQSHYLQRPRTNIESHHVICGTFCIKYFNYTCSPTACVLCCCY